MSQNHQPFMYHYPNQLLKMSGPVKAKWHGWMVLFVSNGSSDTWWEEEQWGLLEGNWTFLDKPSWGHYHSFSLSKSLGAHLITLSYILSLALLQ